MRTITPATLRDMLVEDTGRVILICLTISHPTMATPIRLVNDIKDLTWGGDTFIGMPFTVTLAGETEETISDVTLTVENVDRRMVEAVRTIQSAPTLLLQIVTVDEAGTVAQESGDMVFRLQSVDADALSLSGTLGLEADYLNEPAVKDRFDPTVAPGMF